MASLLLKECGRVLISTDLRLYAIDCNCCKELYTHWDTFLVHIKSEHKKEDEHQLYPIALNSKCAETVNSEAVFSNSEQMDAAAWTSTPRGLVTQPVQEAGDSAVDSTVEERLLAQNCIEEETSISAGENDDNISIEYLEEELERMHEEGNTTTWSTDNNSTSETMAELKEESMLGEVEEQTNIKSIVTFPFESTKEQDVEMFINTLKQHKCLWHRDFVKSSNREMYQKALQALSDARNMSLDATKKEVHRLLLWYTETHKQSNASSSSSNKYYEFCDFLKESLPKSLSKAHRLEGTFDCIYCEKLFSKRTYLDVHLRRHTKEFMHKCKLCNKLTITSSDLRVHMRVHTGEKPYACHLCDKTFKTSSILSQHQRKHQQPSYRCMNCSKAYYSSYQLKNHMNSHLNRRAYKCSYCEKAFTSAKLLYAHKMKLHSELRNNYCKICKKCIPHIEYHLKQMHDKID